MTAPDFVELFISESEDLLAELESGLMSLEDPSCPPETIARIFRAAHTLKGNAGMVGFSAFVQVAHAMENVLARVREGELAGEHAVSPLLAGTDILRRMKDAAARAEEVKLDRDDAATLTALAALVPGPALGDANADDAAATTAAALEQAGFISFESPSPPPVPLATTAASPRAAGRATNEPVSPPKRALAETVRVDTEKLDRLVDIVGELLIAIAATKDGEARNGRTEAGRSVSDALVRIGRQVHEQALALRMVTIESTFERMKRPVRELARELEKEAELVTSGVETELDKRVVEELADPLKHMVRNCLAHGIESKEARRAAGKRETGTIRLHAEQREGHAMITVTDDGAGIDRAVVLRKARERGLIAPGKNPSQTEIDDLLFAPGFSTAARIDEVSGRGVGLDVVRRNVEALRGTVQISSVCGQGTTFTIRLPLTLAILDGMVVRAGEQTYVIPSQSIIEVVDLRGLPNARDLHSRDLHSDDAHRQDARAGRPPSIRVRGAELPVVSLSRVFALAEDDPRAKMIVIVSSERRTFGIAVDAVVGLGQAVVKPLDGSFRLFHAMEPTYRRPLGIVGTSIRGDGTVGLVLDVPGLDRMAFAAA